MVQQSKKGSLSNDVIYYKEVIMEDITEKRTQGWGQGCQYRYTTRVYKIKTKKL